MTHPGSRVSRNIEDAPCRCAARRGTTVLEATISLVILAAALTGTTQLAVTASRASRVADDRLFAADEASNVMERLFVLDWEKLTSERANEEKLSELARSRLQDAALEIEVTSPTADDSNEDGATMQVKRIRVRIHWSNAAGERGRPVELSAWRSRKEASE